MSIFFDFYVGPSGRRFRRAVEGDKADIESFIDVEHTQKIFGVGNIGSLIELCTLSICMINEEKEVVGFIALNDFPNVSGVDPADWEIWIRNMYQRYYLSRNTLFIHFMCCTESVRPFFLEEALVSVFQNDVYLMQIVLFVSPECTGEHLSRYNVLKRRNMTKYPAKRDDDCERNKHSLYAALRQDHCPKLDIRRAVQEDNDDIIDILEKQSPRLKEIYGDYYLSEILGNHAESKRKIIVAEYQEKAVGVMCLSPNINYKKLQSIYEMRPYYGLRRATPLEKGQLSKKNTLLSIFGNPVMTGKVSPFSKMTNMKEMQDSDASKENLSQENVTSLDRTKINFNQRVSISRPKERESNSDINIENIFRPSDDYMHSAHSSISIGASILLEDDPFDYDIVNIDVSLFNLPEINVGMCRSQLPERYSTESRPSMAFYNRKLRKRSLLNPAGDSDTYIYRGKPNAFMIELYGLHENVHPRSGFDMLEVAFEIMNDYDYCIIRVPSADTCFPLLQHFCLVPTKPRTCSTYSLYVAHRSSVVGKLRVRQAECMDIPRITQLFQNIKGKETIWTIENCICGVEHKKHQAFVFTSGLSIVGAGHVESLENLNYLRAKYNLDTYHNHKYHEADSGSKVGCTAVVSVVTYPVFETHYRFFAREIMRLTGSNSLVWMTVYRNKWIAHKANCLVPAMVPVLPRKCDFDFAGIPELLKLSNISQNMMAFCTWFLDKKLTTVPIVNVTSKIVVLGASRTGMAFLNTLLFGDSSTYLSFTNITLISPNGLPYMRSFNPAVETMFPKYHNNTDKYLKSVPYSYYVNVVQGTMVEINKADKYITLTTGNRYYYDMLLILIGKQYQHPNFLDEFCDRDPKSTKYERMDVPRLSLEPEVIKHFDTPDNVFIINRIGDANKALKHVQSYHNQCRDSKILVYGQTIHTYCCLAALLELNVPASNIVFIEPFPSEDKSKTRVSLFYNSYVDETVSKMIKSVGIQVYRSFYFQSWHTVDNYVTSVEFISNSKIITLECSDFFYYGKRGVNPEAFFAINKAGIAYNAGILIDHEFRTKDPYIYAAGPATAYYAKYYAANKKQKYYDSYDVGEKLGTQIKNKLDPLFSSQKPTKVPKSTDRQPRTSSDKSGSDPLSDQHATQLSEYFFTIDQLPTLQKPKVINCKLPGGLQYLEVRSPGKKVPPYYMQSLDCSGYVMETFKGSYFKIHLTNDLIVDGITCLSPAKYSLENFKNLYGRSSVCLNNVYLRYKTKKLDDFYEFFRSPWAFYLYHDHAAELFAMVKELLPKGESKGDTIREALRKICIDPDKSGLENTKLELRDRFESAPYLETITHYVIEWISENDILLPMYVQPSQNAEYTHDIRRNQVFKKKKVSVSKLISKMY